MSKSRRQVDSSLVGEGVESAEVVTAGLLSCSLENMDTYRQYLQRDGNRGKLNLREVFKHAPIDRADFLSRIRRTVKRYSHVRVLNISSNGLDDLCAVLEGVTAGEHGITDINAGRNDFTYTVPTRVSTVDQRSLTQYHYSNTLESLNLESTNIGVRSLIEHVLSRCNRLTSLNIGSNHLGTRGLAPICGYLQGRAVSRSISVKASLTALNLYYSRLNDAGNEGIVLVFMCLVSSWQRLASALIHCHSTHVQCEYVNM